MRETRRIVSAAALVLAVTTEEAGAIETKVYSPYVEPGILELEARGRRTVDNRPDQDNAQQQKYELGYGVTSWWHTAIFGEVEKEPGADPRYTATAWENIFQLTEPGKYWADFGLYVEYAHSHLARVPDELETKLLVEKSVDPFTVTANLIFNREIGSDAGKGVGFEYALRVGYPWLRWLEPGIEAYGEPGRLTGFAATREQEHIVGPVLKGKVNIAGLPGVFVYEAGYLFGVTDASPRGTAKWLIEYEVPF
jgi:hypothetical protein